MAFVFYDLETSGTNTRFDQILQFAALRTDADLIVQERVEMSCRLDRHLVPHPGALATTRRSVAQVTAPELQSHYAMMCDIARLIESWSPAVFIGFNSIRFDEEMLRHSLYRTLHSPYLTSRPGNVRADALTLARAIAFFSPGCLTVPTDAEGHPRFRLHMLNEANGGPAIEAHTALGDAEATLALCTLVQQSDPTCWSRFLQFAWKKAVAALIDQGSAFGLVRFRGNAPRPTAATLLGTTSDPNVRLCMDLLVDLDTLAAADDAEIAAILAAAGSPVVRVRVNACPCVCELWDLPDDVKSGIDDGVLDQRAERVSADPRLGKRLLTLALASETPYPRSPHVEERLYDVLPNPEDEELLRRFHATPWAERQQVLNGMVDPRWRFLGARLIYLEAPQTLDQSRRERMDLAVAARRRAAPGTVPWTSLDDAVAWIKRPESKCPPELMGEFAALLADGGA